MKPKRQERRHAILKKRLAVEALDTLRRAREISSDPPKAMEYFYDVFSRWADPAASFNTNRTVIGITCNQVPLELILACGAVPMRLCNGSYALDQAGAEFLPAKSCSLARAAIGLLSVFQDELNDRLAMIVVPATCDQKRKNLETMAELGFNMHSLEVPPAKDTPEAEFYWQNSVKKLVPALERVTGQRITRRRLADAVYKLQQASCRFRGLIRLQQHIPPLVHGIDLLIVANTFLHDDIDNWTAAVARLNAELENRQEHGLFAGAGSARILLTGSPPALPGLKVPLLIEEAGAVIVADEVCSCSRLLYDPVAAVEPRLYDMLPAVADRYLKPCTCPFFNSGRDRERKLIELATRFKVDGVVYMVYSGCLLYQLEQRAVAQVLRKAQVPMIFVETDTSPEDRGQLVTRIEAFVESIYSKKGGNHPCANSAASISVRPR